MVFHVWLWSSYVFYNDFHAFCFVKYVCLMSFYDFLWFPVGILQDSYMICLCFSYVFQCVSMIFTCCSMIFICFVLMLFLCFLWFYMGSCRIPIGFLQDFLYVVHMFFNVFLWSSYVFFLWFSFVFASVFLCVYMIFHWFL